MSGRRTLGFLIATALFVGAPGAAAQTCPPQCPAPGGKSKRTDCHVEFSGVPQASRRFLVLCGDGDRSCDTGNTPGRCDFEVGVCVNNVDPRFPKCVPSGIDAGDITLRSRKADSDQLQSLRDAVAALLPADAATNTCTTPVTLSVPLNRGSNGRFRKRTVSLKLKATAAGGLKDSDRLSLRCLPAPVEPPQCPVNTGGGPNRMTFRVGADSDLDAGWTGLSHNIGVVEGSLFFACLDDCGTSGDSVCTGLGETDTNGKSGTANGKTFGPPLPVTGAVPACLVNEYREDITLTAIDLATGALDAELRLASKVHLSSSPLSPCPVCDARSVIGARGTCLGGARDGQKCTVEGLSGFGNMSSDCLPAPADLAATITIDLDLTTGTTTLPADDTCTGQGNCACPGQTRSNDCDTTCSADACPSGVNMGVDQLCCTKAGTGRGCFAGDVTRTGAALAPAPAWGDAVYPKAVDGLELAATFCTPATATNIINVFSGLAGPGAILLPGSLVVERTVCTAGASAGQPCATDEECPDATCE
jgi:hypothetical protein